MNAPFGRYIRTCCSSVLVWHKTGILLTMARILVADDDPYLRDFLLRFLTEEGYDVETAVDGPQALAMVTASPPDLLITDLLMPGLTGWSVYARVRTQVPGLPILIISAAGTDVLALETILPEHAVFLPKPFDLEQLLAAVTRLLEGG